VSVYDVCCGVAHTLSVFARCLCSMQINIAVVGLLHVWCCYCASQLFVVDNCIDDWRIAMSARRLLQLSLELVICSLHPPPGAFYFEWRPVYHETDDREESGTSRLVPVDALLALPMFLRLYLVCRQAAPSVLRGCMCVSALDIC